MKKSFPILLMSLSILALSGCEKSKEEIKEEPNPAGGTPIVKEPVDLGLSVKWAPCNVGASKPEEYGDYFAWGETEPYYSSLSPLEWKEGKSSGYNWDSYFDSNFDKYDIYYGKTVLDLEDDVAHVNWGGDWRMPTNDEWSELSNTDNCTWTWYDSDNTEFGGIAGYKVTSKKSGYESNFIFLPVSGLREGTNLSYVGSEGYYWSSSLNSKDSSKAYSLYFFLSEGYFTSSYIRNNGCSVRPVCK